jgi:hypothetical protein
VLQQSDGPLGRLQVAGFWRVCALLRLLLASSGSIAKAPRPCEVKIVLTSRCLGLARHVTLVCQPVPPKAKTPKRPWLDSNLQPLVPKNAALFIRPQGVLATRPHEPALGELSPALGRQRCLSRKEGMQDRPLRADGEEGICFSHQAPLQENLNCTDAWKDGCMGAWSGRVSSWRQCALAAGGTILSSPPSISRAN